MSLRRFCHSSKGRNANAALAADRAPAEGVQHVKTIPCQGLEVNFGVLFAFIMLITLSPAHCPAFKSHFLQKFLFNQPPAFVHGTNCPEAENETSCNETLSTWL